MNFCPNLANLEVKRNFQQMIDVSSENAAYQAYNFNAGQFMDKAPNGEPSMLYQTLLSRTNGDVNAAVATKIALYSNKAQESLGKLRKTHPHMFDTNGEFKFVPEPIKSDKSILQNNPDLKEGVSFNAQEAADIVFKNASKDTLSEHKEFLENLFNVAKKVGVTYTIHAMSKNSGLSIGNLVIMGTMTMAGVPQHAAYVIVHETIHAVTATILEKYAENPDGEFFTEHPEVKDAIDKLETLYVELLKDPNFKQQYASKNMFEFLAEALHPNMNMYSGLINEEVVEESAKPQGMFAEMKSKITSFIHAVFDFVQKLFGAKNEREHLTVQDEMKKYVSTIMNNAWNSDTIKENDVDVQHTIKDILNFVNGAESSDKHHAVHYYKRGLTTWGKSRDELHQFADYRKRVDKLATEATVTNSTALDQFRRQTAIDDINSALSKIVDVASNVPTVAALTNMHKELDTDDNAQVFLFGQLLSRLFDGTWSSFEDTIYLDKFIQALYAVESFHFENDIQKVLQNDRSRNRASVVRQIVAIYQSGDYHFEFVDNINNDMRRVRGLLGSDAQTTIDVISPASIVAYEVQPITKAVEAETVFMDVVNERIKRVREALAILGKRSDTVENQTTLKRILDILRNIKLNTNSMSETIENMVAFITNDVNDKLERLENLQKDVAASRNINANALYSEYKDVITTYKLLITQDLINVAAHIGDEYKETVAQAVAIISTAIAMYETKYDDVVNTYLKHQIDKIIDKYFPVGDTDVLKKAAEEQIIRLGITDLGGYEMMLRAAQTSKSIAVRLVDALIRNADTATAHTIYDMHLELIELYNKAVSTTEKISLINAARQFYELDSDGNTTGNYISDVNIGQFEKDKEKKLKEICKKYNVPYDDYNHRPIIEDRKIYIEVYNELDDWLEGRQHRRYRAEYYKLRRSILSQDTIEILDEITNMISKLTAEHYDESVGAVVFEGPDDPAYVQYVNLKNSRLELSSPFLFEVTPMFKHRVVGIKTGEAFRMANEIAAFNKATRGRIGYKPNEAKYQEALEKMKAKYGENSKEVAAFIDMNTANQYTSEFYALYEGIFEETNEPDSMYQQLASILKKKTKPKQGAYTPDLLGIDFDTYKLLHDYYEEVVLNPSDSDFEPDVDAIDNLNAVAKSELLVIPDSHLTYYDAVRAAYLRAGHTSREADDLFTVVVPKKNGTFKRVPLPIFYGRTINDAHKSEFILENAPSGQFSELDVNSELVDDKYNPEDPYMNIDRTLYANPEFAKIKNNPDKLAFYNKVLEIMQKSMEKYPAQPSRTKFTAVQRRGNLSQLASRNTLNGKRGFKVSLKGLFAGMVFGTLSAGIISNVGPIFDMINDMSFTQALTAIASYVSAFGLTGLLTGHKVFGGSAVDTIIGFTERDIEFNRNADDQSVPIRYTERLANPEDLDTDIVGSVLDMYLSAVNFENKSKILGLIEMIEQKTRGGVATPVPTDVSKRIETHKSIYLFGNTIQGISSKRVSKSTVMLHKLFGMLKSLVHTAFMVFNTLSMVKAMLQSFGQTSIYYTSSRLSNVFTPIHAAGILVFNALGALRSMSSPYAKSKLIAIMRMGNIGQNLYDVYSGSNKWRARRVVEQLWDNFLQQGIDFTQKAWFTAYAYLTIRVIKHPVTHKEYLVNKDNAVKMFASLGFTKKEGAKAWSDSKVSLYDIYKLENGKAVIKDQYKHLLETPENSALMANPVQQQVEGFIRDNTAVINGMFTDYGKNSLSSSVLMQPLLHMRGWLVSLTDNASKDGEDFKRTVGTEGSKYSYAHTGNGYDGIAQFSTGTVERGWWNYIRPILADLIMIHKIGSKLSRWSVQRKEAAVYFLAQVSLFALLTLGQIASQNNLEKTLLRVYTKQIKHGSVEHLGAHIAHSAMTSTRAEQLGQMGSVALIPTILELMTSITVDKAGIDNLFSPITAVQDLYARMELKHRYPNKHSYLCELAKLPQSKKVVQGVYTGYTQREKNAFIASQWLPFFNSTGAANIAKSLNPDSYKARDRFYGNAVPSPLKLEPINYAKLRKNPWRAIRSRE